MTPSIDASRKIANTCTKLFSDYPFAHRQPKHAGHCAQIHGHNWSFEVTFSATELDECGFVVDFGGLAWAKKFLTENFDHTTVLNEDDPARALLEGANVMMREALTEKPQHRLSTDAPRRAAPMFNFVFIPDCSCEGIARLVLEVLNAGVLHRTDGRVTVSRVRVFEDSKNSATATWG